MLKIFSSLGGESSAKLGEAIGAADAARDARNWPNAALLYRKALDIDSSLAPIWVQYGHALKESHNLTEAEAAYQHSLAINDQVADTHLQLGHLLKILDRKADAIESYNKALQITPNDPVIKREIDECKKGLGSKFYQSSGSNHIYFDISDFVFYIGHHENLTGIQRVQASIILALLNADLRDVVVHFLTYVNSQRSFYEIDQSFVVSLLYDLSFELGARQVPFDRDAAKDGYIRDAVPFKPPGVGNNVLCLLGAAWVNRDYFLRIRNLKQRHGFRFLHLIHDLIPIFASETCDQDHTAIFESFFTQSYYATDGYLCISQSTKKDLIRYFAGLGRSISEPVVTQNGTLLPTLTRPTTLKSIDSELETKNYILFVSTIEGRKNHLIAFRAFEKLLNERNDVPYLVCVGRLGWRAEEFLFACQDTDFLHGKIKLLSDISDNELVALYANCLFTIYPSFYEGWGLPVGESLGSGKVCITSNLTSLPEVGGDFAHYVDPLQPAQFAEAISYYLDNPAALDEAEARIKSQYRGVEWTDVASRVVEACFAQLESPVKSALPALELRREYPVCLPPKLPSILYGERMVEWISSMRRRFMTPGLYRDADYALGQAARSGDGWCEPEEGRTWVRANGAMIAFVLANPNRDKLVMFIAYQAAEPFIGATLTLESSGGHRVSYEITRPRGHLAVQGLRPVHSSGQGYYSVSLRISGQHDPNATAFAIRSFIVVPETDVSARLNILEKLSAA